MSSFTSPLSVSPMPDGREWKVVEPFEYHVGKKDSEDKITVPKGFKTDFASLPTLASPIFTLIGLALILFGRTGLGIAVLTLICVLSWLRNWAKYSKAPIVHDWLYHSKQIMGKPINRKKADEVFLEAMLVEWRDDKTRYRVAYLEYWSVRTFAWFAWKTKTEVDEKTLSL